MEEEKDVVTTRAAKVLVNDAVIYEVMYGCLTKEQAINEADFETILKSNYKGLGKCATVAQGAASPGLEGYKGRYYKAQCTTEDGSALSEAMSVYLGKRHYYTMTVTWRSDDPEPAQDIKRFLQSIRVLDPAK